MNPDETQVLNGADLFKVWHENDREDDTQLTDRLPRVDPWGE